MKGSDGANDAVAENALLAKKVGEGRNGPLAGNAEDGANALDGVKCSEAASEGNGVKVCDAGKV